MSNTHDSVTKPYPIVEVIHTLNSSKEAFQRFRTDARTYLKNEGLKPSSKVFKILTEVPRHGQLTRENLGKIIDAILAEVVVNEEGPLETNRPILTAFYLKFVKKESIEWGPFGGVRDALLDELVGNKLVW